MTSELGPQRGCVIDASASLKEGYHMERPTSALHLSRITLDLRQLRAEPHTKSGRS